MLSGLGTLKSATPGTPQDGSVGGGGSRLDLSKVSALCLLPFLLVIEQCSGKVLGVVLGCLQKGKVAYAPLPLPPTLQRAPLWLSTHPSGS